MQQYNVDDNSQILKVARALVFIATVYVVGNQSLIWFGWHYCWEPWTWGSYWCEVARQRITLAQAEMAVAIVLALCGAQCLHGAWR